MSKLVKLRGMVDVHVHLRDMDWSHKATFASETAAAVAGGYWAVCDMPNTPPSTVTESVLNQKLEKAGRQSYCDFGIYYGASQIGNWDSYDAVIDRVCGLKMYNNATTGDLLIDNQRLREEHYRRWPAHKVVAVHAEGETIPEILELVRRYRKRTHFCHISSAEEIRFLEAAKREGLPITIGVTPHHLYLSHDDLASLGSFGLMKPELKTRQDCEALWDAIASGLVDVIESDHAPHTRQEKESSTPPFGVPGLETTLPLMLLGVKDGRLSLERMIDLLTINGQQIMNIQPGEGTYTLVQSEVEYTIDGARLKSRCGWTPFDGMQVTGKIREVWIRRQKVYDGEQVLVPESFGRNLFGAPGG